jgi:uncharacterized protein YyaL (SSP411 family)
MTGLHEWRAAIDRVIDAVLRDLAAARAPTGAALTLLVRRYAATGRDDIRGALETSLAESLDAWPEAAPRARAYWLTLFVEAAALSPDDRIPVAAQRLVQSFRDRWGSDGELASIAAGLAACLDAAGVSEVAGLLPAAIDELERIIGLSYRPGQGVAHMVNGPAEPRGGLADQVCAASALLTAYTRTGRLPYAMLAEELMQSAGRLATSEKPDGGIACALSDRTAPFVDRCEAARVLGRLAQLHRDAEYREKAVVAPAADYAADVEAMLNALAPEAGTRGIEAAVYGLAAEEWLQSAHP